MMHVKREANEAAHGLAKLVAREKTDKVWMEEIPSSIYSILILEQFTLSV
jgi:hypothetical protein